MGYKFRRQYKGDGDSPVVVCGRTVLIECEGKASVVGLRLRLGAPSISDKTYRATVAPPRHGHHLSSSLLNLFNEIRKKKKKLVRYGHGAEWVGMKSQTVQEHFSVRNPSPIKRGHTQVPSTHKNKRARKKSVVSSKKTQYTLKTLAANTTVCTHELSAFVT